MIFFDIAFSAPMFMNLLCSQGLCLAVCLIGMKFLLKLRGDKRNLSMSLFLHKYL